MRVITVLGLISLIIVPADVYSADGKDKKKAALSAKEADQDFKYQGEYLGELGSDEDKMTWGAQVIALGDGKFHVKSFAGGLPGVLCSDLESV